MEKQRLSYSHEMNNLEIGQEVIAIDKSYGGAARETSGVSGKNINLSSAGRLSSMVASKDITNEK